jgi:DNA-binding PadR family transcriptional regulator
VTPPTTPEDLSLTEWAVLTLVDEAPTHGFAVSKVLAPSGDVGRIWRVPRPLVYRALAVLDQRGLVEEIGSEEGPGPRRTVVRATGPGSAAVERWLQTPEPHVRDLRTGLLVRLKLLHRRGAGLGPLAAAQLALLTPMREALDEQFAASDGFDRVLVAWRRQSTEAAERFLTSLMTET